MNDEEMNQLDRRMAEGVMGWIFCGEGVNPSLLTETPVVVDQVGETVKVRRTGRSIRYEPFSPTRKPADALEVLRKLVETKCMSVHRIKTGYIAHGIAPVTRDYRGFSVQAPTLELAICLFADGVTQ